MKNPKVAVITATTGTKYLADNIQSVEEQTYENVTHHVFVDGLEHWEKAEEIYHSHEKVYNTDIQYLNNPTGKNGYNGHRIYAAASFLIDADYFVFLDEDNWLEPNHVEELVKVVPTNGWAYSLRQIRDMEGNFICNDECESLGAHVNIMNEKFVDVNCFFLPKHLAINLSPIWYRRARHPHEQPEVDRYLSNILFQQLELRVAGSGIFSVNYRAGNRADSVQPEFFIRGNREKGHAMLGNAPWRKK